MDYRRVGLKLAFISLPFILVIFVCFSIHAQTGILDRLAGRDLWKHRPTRAESVQLQQLVGSVPKGIMMEPLPWYIWKAHHRGRRRYVVLLGESLMSIPGGTSACVRLFDEASTTIQSWSFQTGWRNELTSALVKYSTELGTDVLVLRTAPVINGRDIASEYFAIDDDRLRLIRLEDSKGAVVQNEYVFPNYEIGNVPSEQTVEAWTSLLRSNDKSDVLSALVFLGGRHLDEQQRMGLPAPHESKYAALFQQLVATPAVHDSITQLTNSGNAWIRDAAFLAARDPRQRQLR